MQHKWLPLSARCIIVAIITLRKGIIWCKVIEKWDQNYITLFLFTVETENYFHWRNSTNHHPPRAPFPSQLLQEHMAAMWKQSLREGSGFTVDCWIRVLGFIFSTGSTITLAWRAVHWRVCICVCVYVCARKHHRSPKCNTARLHTPRAPCRMSIPKLLSFSMNAQVCNLAPTNWIRISGGFIPPGSAWSPVFHCNNCQSWGGTEVHIWTRGFVPAFNSACLSSQCKPLLK